MSPSTGATHASVPAKTESHSARVLDANAAAMRPRREGSSREIPSRPSSRLNSAKNFASSAPTAIHCPSDVWYTSYQGTPPSSRFAPRSSRHSPAASMLRVIVLSDTAPSTMAASTTWPRPDRLADSSAASTPLVR